MLKHSIRWIVPLTVLLVLAVALVIVPAIATHAATVVHPDIFWQPK